MVAKNKIKRIRDEYTDFLEKHIDRIKYCDALENYWIQIKKNICHSAKAPVAYTQLIKNKNWFDEEKAEFTNKKNHAHKQCCKYILDIILKNIKKLGKRKDTP